MKTANFNHTLEIGEEEINLEIEARVISDKDGTGETLFNIDMDIYIGEGKDRIEVSKHIYSLCPKLQKDLEDYAMEVME